MTLFIEGRLKSYLRVALDHGVSLKAQLVCVAVLLCSLISMPAAADHVTKCVIDGKTVYSKVPCPGSLGTQQEDMTRREEKKKVEIRAEEVKKEAQVKAATPAFSADGSSISVRGRTFRIGDTADDIFKTLKPADSKKKDVGPDPAVPGSLLVTHHYEVEGNSFSLTFARDHEPGAYLLSRISTSSHTRTNVAPEVLTPTEN